MKGYIYALSNPAMPGLIKIGRSIEGGRVRAGAIRGTGVPEDFCVEFECLFDDCKEAEKNIHDELSQCRTNPKREFFSIEPGEAKEVILRHCAYEMDHTVCGADFTVCDARMGAVAHKFQVAPPVPYDAVEFISDEAWADAIAERARRIAGLQRGDRPSLSIVEPDADDEPVYYYVTCDRCQNLWLEYPGIVYKADGEVLCRNCHLGLSGDALRFEGLMS